MASNINYKHDYQTYIQARLNTLYIYIFRAENTLVMVKSTIFKGKIFGRSEVEIKEYFKTWKQNVEEKGYLDP